MQTPHVAAGSLVGLLVPLREGVHLAELPAHAPQLLLLLGVVRVVGRSVHGRVLKVGARDALRLRRETGIQHRLGTVLRALRTDGTDETYHTLLRGICGQTERVIDTTHHCGGSGDRRSR